MNVDGAAIAVLLVALGVTHVYLNSRKLKPPPTGGLGEPPAATSPPASSSPAIAAASAQGGHVLDSVHELLKQLGADSPATTVQAKVVYPGGTSTVTITKEKVPDVPPSA